MSRHEHHITGLCPCAYNRYREDIWQPIHGPMFMVVPYWCTNRYVWDGLRGIALSLRICNNFQTLLFLLMRLVLQALGALTEEIGTLPTLTLTIVFPHQRYRPIEETSEGNGAEITHDFESRGLQPGLRVNIMH